MWWHGVIKEIQLLSRCKRKFRCSNVYLSCCCCPRLPKWPLWRHSTIPPFSLRWASCSGAGRKSRPIRSNSHTSPVAAITLYTHTTFLCFMGTPAVLMTQKGRSQNQKGLASPRGDPITLSVVWVLEYGGGGRGRTRKCALTEGGGDSLPIRGVFSHRGFWKFAFWLLRCRIRG